MAGMLRGLYGQGGASGSKVLRTSALNALDPIIGLMGSGELLLEFVCACKPVMLYGMSRHQTIVHTSG